MILVTPEQKATIDRGIEIMRKITELSAKMMQTHERKYADELEKLFKELKGEEP